MSCCHTENLIQFAITQGYTDKECIQAITSLKKAGRLSKVDAAGLLSVTKPAMRTFQEIQSELEFYKSKQDIANSSFVKKELQKDIDSAKESFEVLKKQKGIILKGEIHACDNEGNIYTIRMLENGRFLMTGQAKSTKTLDAAMRELQIILRKANS